MGLEVKLELEEAQAVDLTLLKELQGKVVEVDLPRKGECYGIIGRVGLSLVEISYIKLFYYSNRLRTCVYNISNIGNITMTERWTSEDYIKYWEDLEAGRKNE